MCSLSCATYLSFFSILSFLSLYSLPSSNLMLQNSSLHNDKISISTRVVPKLVLTLCRWTCNTIYLNFNEARVFCSLLSFQQTPADVFISNRSRVTAGFVITSVCTPLENERCKKKQTKKMGSIQHLEAWKV